MAVTTLYELCRRELRGLLDMRYMPRGWNREGNRKAELRFNEVHKMLEARIALGANYLVANPTRQVLNRILSDAASERMLKDMVEKYVEQMRALPVPDQTDAFAAAELRSRSMYLERVKSQIITSRQKLAETVGNSGVRGVDFASIFAQLDDAVAQIEKESQTVQTTMETYEEVL